jgi:aspartyl aminopeptidase
MLNHHSVMVKPVVKRTPAADPHSWKRRWSREQIADPAETANLAEGYKGFLDECRTERECVRWTSRSLRSLGFSDLSQNDLPPAEPGRGFFLANREGGIAFGRVGTEDFLSGTNLLVFHLDSPRLDLKPIPLAGDGDTGLGLVRTHYYGGIKKYHWVNIPLTLRGTLRRSDGTSVDVSGEGWTLVIPDLEPHLSHKAQDHRKLPEGIQGEELVALAAQSTPDPESDVQPVVRSMLESLNRTYGTTEEDLICSDLCLVPQFSPRDIGLDRGMVGAYGQDDRVSAFSAFRAVTGTPSPARWAVAIGFDKEEIGSDGPTGAKSAFLELLYYKLLDWTGHRGSRRELNMVFTRTFCISSDVKAAVDPIFKGVHDIQNAARAGSGITITKYTGSGGKAGTNDASAEMVHALRSHFANHEIAWQMQETGKVDEGGGGTVARFMAYRNMDVLDVGIPVFSMHSKFEVVSKADLHMAVKAFSAFFSDFNPSRLPS